MEKKRGGYDFQKPWFDFIETTDEVVTPMHTSLYLWIVELNNRLQWCPIVGLPTDRTMKMCLIKSYKWYKKTLYDLIRWGFIELKEKSYNQYTCNQIALILNTKANTEAVLNQRPKQLPHNKTIETNKNNTNFFSEKTNSEFQKFLEEREKKEGSPISEVRITEYKDRLKSLSDSGHNENELCEVIKRAIRGEHKDFVPLAEKKKSACDVLADSTIKQRSNIMPPTVQEFIKYFEENGYSKDLAERVYNDFAYNKKWKDNSGFSMVETWKDVIRKNNFFKSNKKR